MHILNEFKIYEGNIYFLSARCSNTEKDGIVVIF
jgi:hypothetical protein